METIIDILNIMIIIIFIYAISKPHKYFIREDKDNIFFDKYDISIRKNVDLEFASEVRDFHLHHERDQQAEAILKELGLKEQKKTEIEPDQPWPHE